MITPPIQQLLKKVDCRYTLVVMTSMRARELVAGATPMVSTREVKPVSIAVQEIDQNHVSYRRLESSCEA